jgi:hypothetical protein
VDANGFWALLDSLFQAWLVAPLGALIFFDCSR